MCIHQDSRKRLKLIFVASMALYCKHRQTVYFSSSMYSLPTFRMLMSAFQRLLCIIYADNVGVTLSLGWGCILRTNKQIYYLEAQVLSGNVAPHWVFKGTIIRPLSVSDMKC